MLVQRLADRLRLITQHHHGIVAGQIAEAWGNEFFEAPRPRFETVLAVTLHDLVWEESDRFPPWNPETGQPFDFITLPLPERIALYRSGVDRVARIHPYAGLLASLHFEALVGEAGGDVFRQGERRRRERLAAFLAPEAAAHGPALQLNHRFLVLCDTLSLYLCLASPAVSRASLPPWLARPELRFPARPWSGEQTEPVFLRLRWHGASVLSIDPFPLCGPIEVRVPVRDIPPGPYPDPISLRRAVEGARWEWWSVEVVPA